MNKNDETIVVEDDKFITPQMNEDERQKVNGNGGIFRWNGVIYSTYTEDEWKAMSDKEKTDFAYAVKPEVRADEIVVERMKEMTEDVPSSQTEAVHSTSHSAMPSHQENVKEAISASDDIATNHTQQDLEADDNDVHVVGQGTLHGHQAVALGITGNGEADVAIID